MTLSERAELKAAIKFYERRGWDWSDIVEYLLMKSTDRLDEVFPKYSKLRFRAGRPGKHVR